MSPVASLLGPADGFACPGGVGPNSSCREPFPKRRCTICLFVAQYQRTIRQLALANNTGTPLRLLSLLGNQDRVPGALLRLLGRLTVLTVSLSILLLSVFFGTDSTTLRNLNYFPRRGNPLVQTTIDDRVGGDGRPQAFSRRRLHMILPRQYHRNGTTKAR